LAALIFSALWIPAVLAFVGYYTMGDCADPVEPCMAAKRSVGLPMLAVGLAVLVLVNWLLLRRRDRD
jgi:hypothetical protein